MARTQQGTAKMMDRGEHRIDTAEVALFRAPWPWLGIAAVLAVLSALLVGFYTAAVSERSFDALRQRGISLARLVAQVTAGTGTAPGRIHPETIPDQLSGQEELGYAALGGGSGRVPGRSGPGARAAPPLLG